VDSLFWLGPVPFCALYEDVDFSNINLFDWAITANAGEIGKPCVRDSDSEVVCLKIAFCYVDWRPELNGDLTPFCNSGLPVDYKTEIEDELYGEDCPGEHVPGGGVGGHQLQILILNGV
jgi:hypothetical protein